MLYRLVSLAMATLAVSLSCASAYPLPDRSDPRVLAREQQLVKIIETDGGLIGRGASCDIRLLGSEGRRYFVWAKCASPERGAVSTALVVEGSEVTAPHDPTYEQDVNDMFPTSLAREILAGGERLQPSDGSP
jgi:hypothetical protein